MKTNKQIDKSEENQTENKQTNKYKKTETQNRKNAYLFGITPLVESKQLKSTEAFTLSLIFLLKDKQAAVIWLLLIYHLQNHFF